MKTITIWWLDDFTWTYRWNYEAEQGWICGGAGFSEVRMYDMKYIEHRFIALRSMTRVVDSTLYVMEYIMHQFIMPRSMTRSFVSTFDSINVIGYSVFRVFTILRTLPSRLRWWIYITSHATTLIFRDYLFVRTLSDMTLSIRIHPQESPPESEVRNPIESKASIRE